MQEINLERGDIVRTGSITSFGGMQGGVKIRNQGCIIKFPGIRESDRAVYKNFLGPRARNPIFIPDMLLYCFPVSQWIDA